MPRPQPIRHKDGSIVWRVRFRIEGQRNPVSETFDSAEEAQVFASLVEKVGGAAARQARSLSAISGSEVPTFAQAFERQCDRTVASDEHIRLRRQRYRDYMEASLGPYPVDLISNDMVIKWVKHLRETIVRRGVRKGQKMAASTVRAILGQVVSILEDCVEDGVIARNPAAGIDVPDDTASHDPVFLTPNQFTTLLQAMPEQWRPLTATLYGLGIRFGEAAALRVSDVDLEASPPVVRVTKTWRESKGGYDAPPKTKAGRRIVSVPESLVDVLRSQMEGKSAEDVLFPASRGGHIRRASFHKSVWTKAVTVAGLSPRPHVHDLRHSHASALIAAGVPLTVIQRRLGHSSIQVTSDIYGHLAPTAQVQAAAAIDLSLTQALPEVEAEVATVNEIVGEVAEERQIEGA